MVVIRKAIYLLEILPEIVIAVVVIEYLILPVELEHGKSI